MGNDKAYAGQKPSAPTQLAVQKLVSDYFPEMFRDRGFEYAMTNTNRIVFLPQGITSLVQTGCTVLDAALDHGIDLPHECGGNCACTTCLVIVEAGMEHLSPMQEPEADRLA